MPQHDCACTVYNSTFPEISARACHLALQVFNNCTCISDVMTPGMNVSAVLGQCPRKSDCDHSFKIYMALSTLGAFISACGSTPGYIVLLRCGVWRERMHASVPVFSFTTGCGSSLCPMKCWCCTSRSIQKDLKSLALGMQTLIVRTLGEYISLLSWFMIKLLKWFIRFIVKLCSHI